MSYSAIKFNFYGFTLLDEIFLLIPGYEFNALDRDDEEQHSSTSEVQKNKIRGNARLKLYKRYLPKIFGEEWFFNFDGNNAIVNKR